MATSVGRHNTVAALLSYIGTYYILDFEYSQNDEVGLTILHYLFFQDTCTDIFYSHSIIVSKNIIGTSCQVKKMGEGSADLKF